MGIIALLALCVTAVAATGPERIIGGSPATISEYPSMAALLTDARFIGMFRQHCGGTIINNRSILTAAFCIFNNESVDRWRVRVGSTTAHSGGDVYEIRSILIHPDYERSTQNNDIAIMHTGSNIRFSDNVQAAAIAGSSYNLGNDQVVWTAGWGVPMPHLFNSETLNHVQMLTVDQELCRERYLIAGVFINENKLCAGNIKDGGGRDHCYGDTGGPLFHNRVVVGVTSFAYSCGSPFHPGVSTRVSSYSSWIQNNA